MTNVCQNVARITNAQTSTNAEVKFVFWLKNVEAMMIVELRNPAQLNIPA